MFNKLTGDQFIDLQVPKLKCSQKLLFLKCLINYTDCMTCVQGLFTLFCFITVKYHYDKWKIHVINYKILIIIINNNIKEGRI